METNEKKVLLSLRNVEVKFNVRGRILTAIRNVSLDVYENESLAIVGESGSGKSTIAKLITRQIDATTGTIETKNVAMNLPRVVPVSQENIPTLQKQFLLLV